MRHYSKRKFKKKFGTISTKVNGNEIQEEKMNRCLLLSIWTVIAVITVYSWYLVVKVGSMLWRLLEL